MTDAAEKKPRKPRAKKLDATKAGEAAPTTPLPPPAEDASRTHTFVYGEGRYATCACGAQNDVRLAVGGKTARFYRAPEETDWQPTIARCAKYVAPPPPPPVVVEAPRPRLTPEERQARRERLAKANPDMAAVGAFDPEIILGCDVEDAADDVDLTVAFSPVLVRPLPKSAGSIYGPGCSLEEQRQAAMIPVEATDLGNGRYRVYGDRFGIFSTGLGMCDVNADELRVMRARFLLQRGALQRQLPRLDVATRERWMRLYKIHWMPPEGSPLAEQIQTGEPITIHRDEAELVDYVALIAALSTAGAVVPDTCPVVDMNPEQL